MSPTPAAGASPSRTTAPTAQGARAYEQWLVCQVQQDRRRSQLFVHQLAMLSPSTALRVIERYERGLPEAGLLARAGTRPGAGRTRGGRAGRAAGGGGGSSGDRRQTGVDRVRAPRARRRLPPNRSGRPDEPARARGGQPQCATGRARADRAARRVAELDSRELVAVWGKRDAGCSTLLRVAAGIEPPDSGVVRFAGRPLSARRERCSARGSATAGA